MEVVVLFPVWREQAQTVGSEALGSTHWPFKASSCAIISLKKQTNQS